MRNRDHEQEGQILTVTDNLIDVAPQRDVGDRGEKGRHDRNDDQVVHAPARALDRSIISRTGRRSLRVLVLA